MHFFGMLSSVEVVWLPKSTLDLDDCISIDYYLAALEIATVRKRFLPAHKTLSTAKPPVSTGNGFSGSLPGSSCLVDWTSNAGNHFALLTSWCRLESPSRSFQLLLRSDRSGCISKYGQRNVELSMLQMDNLYHHQVKVRVAANSN